MKKALKIVGAILGVLLVVAVGIRIYMKWQQGQDLLPAFKPVPEGARSPTRDFLGLTIRETTLPEAEVIYRGTGAECKGSSFRDLMGAKRESIKKEMAEVKASGGDPDAVSGASLANYRSKKERNPQVRLSCIDVPLSSFNDRERVPGEPLYWLIIFDSPDFPLRHVSVGRRITDLALAEEEWRLAVDAMTKKFGAPTKIREPAQTGVAFTPGTYFEAKWTFTDIEASVTAFRIGNYVRFQERVEVPWPVTAKEQN